MKNHIFADKQKVGLESVVSLARSTTYRLEFEIVVRTVQKILNYE